MKKWLEIENCGNCKHCCLKADGESNEVLVWCHKEKKELPDQGSVWQKIPDWCQLPDNIELEPPMIKKGDSRVLINGKYPEFDCRIITESMYQKLTVK